MPGYYPPSQTRTSERRDNAGGGVVGLLVLGAGFFAAGLAGEAYNEYRSVATLRTIQMGRQYLKESSCVPDPALGDQLVHVSCELSGLKTFGSNIVGVQDLPEQWRVGLRLESKCEVREWTEAKTKDSSSDDDKRTTRYSYSYKRMWSTQFVDSSAFARPSDCARTNNYQKCVNTDPEDQPWWTIDMQLSQTNPAADFYVVDTAAALKLGGFSIPPDMQKRLGREAIALHPYLDCSKGPKHCPAGVTAASIYVSYQDLKGPPSSLTPMRRQFRVANASHASVIGKQKGNTFVPWQSPYDAKYSLYYAMDGMVSAEDMLLAAERDNAALTWALRGASLAMTWAGLMMLLWPIELLVAWLPCGVGDMLGALVGCGICIFSTLVASSCWLLVCGVSWVYFRPQVGYPLVVGGVLIAVYSLYASSCPASAPGEREREREIERERERGGRDAEASAPLLFPDAQEEDCHVHVRPETRPPPVNPGSQTLDEQDECVVCLVKRKNRLLRPCGHVCVCEGCSTQITACPICRAPISEAIRAFV